MHFILFYPYFNISIIILHWLYWVFVMGRSGSGRVQKIQYKKLIYSAIIKIYFIEDDKNDDDDAEEDDDYHHYCKLSLIICLL